MERENSEPTIPEHPKPGDSVTFLTTSGYKLRMRLGERHLRLLAENGTLTVDDFFAWDDGA